MRMEFMINGKEVCITAEMVEITIDTPGERVKTIELTHGEFKQIWRFMAHFNQIKEAEKCEK